MKIINIPPFILAAIALFIGMLSFLIKPDEALFNYPLLTVAITLAAIYWVWMIVLVTGTKHLLPYQKEFWLILIVSVPFIGAMLYQLLHQRSKKLVN
jgi:uncharacterized membrane protein YhaH (DUF805 family)